MMARITFIRAAQWFAALAVLGCSGASIAGPAELELGRRLFTGEAPLRGRVLGHNDDLPAQASRCANCHAAGSAPPIGAAAASTPTLGASSPSFGPALNAELLVREQRRRGGPPSRYDEKALCKLLGSGIDPAYIIIPRNMPRYELAAAECHALWTYLTTPRR